ncbi:MAG: class I SAM-dependent methyltransferase [Terracidiphilus sp.]
MNRLVDLSSTHAKTASADGLLEATFRDPAGQLRLTDKCALRQIRPAAWEETQAFLASPLRKTLEQSGDLIASKMAGPDDHACIAAGELWLEHPRVDPISYPWEWTTAQWRAAAELTLRVAGHAIPAGWTLKDATPLNIVFAGPRPVLVDVLSFERRDPRATVWLAYGQFARTFLLPLVAAKYLSWPLQATLFTRDGYEPADIYRALPRRQRINPALFDVVTLATLLERRGRKAAEAKKMPSASDPKLAEHILQKRIARLGKQIRHAAGAANRSQWSDYTQLAHHYQPADIDQKQKFVREALERCRPAEVLDIGANTGSYSRIAAETGAKVVALDSDAAALEALWEMATRESLDVTALVANIARPTPAAGWRNREHLSLLDRLTGKFDLVLMLAVIHHLILREQLPLKHIAELSASLTRRWLLVEWVPPSDPMYQEWLRGRDELYGHLTEDDLKRAYSPLFAVADRLELSNRRVLLLLERTVEQKGATFDAEEPHCEVQTRDEASAA